MFPVSRLARICVIQKIPSQAHATSQEEEEKERELGTRLGTRLGTSLHAFWREVQ